MFVLMFRPSNGIFYYSFTELKFNLKKYNGPTELSQSACYFIISIAFSMRVFKTSTTHGLPFIQKELIFVKF